MVTPISFLVISKPGRYRDSLIACLKGITGVEIIQYADTLAAAIVLLETSTPNFLLLDYEIESNPGISLHPYRNAHPEMKMVALVENETERRRAVRDCMDQILVKGFTIDRLISLFSPQKHSLR